MMKHLGGPEGPEKLAERHAGYQEAGSCQYRVVVKESGERVGWVGYWERTWRRQDVWEIGWSVIPSFQGKGVASSATAQLIEQARADGRLQFIHAYPSVENEPSNRICQMLGFSLLGEVDFEYPTGHFMRSNDWCLDLFPENPNVRLGNLSTGG
jgi:RimJ/RimL family protein N-acetyltransferase